MKTAVITGGSSGIGKAIIETLKDNGWKVIAPSRKQMDLTDLAEVEKVAAKLAGTHQPIDALIHVAGVWHNKSAVYANKDLEDFTPEQIIETMLVGLTSFMVLTAKLLPRLSKHGAVVGITGTFGDGASGWLPYYTSKRALEDFLVGLAQDYPSGPNVFGISPADTATPAYEKFYPQYASGAQPPKAVANLCLELLNGQTGYKSGSIIELRGGKTKPGFHV